MKLVKLVKVFDWLRAAGRRSRSDNRNLNRFSLDFYLLQFLRQVDEFVDAVLVGFLDVFAIVRIPAMAIYPAEVKSVWMRTKRAD